MEEEREFDELLELLEAKQYTKLRQHLAEMNEADIAAWMEHPLLLRSWRLHCCNLTQSLLN